MTDTMMDSADATDERGRTSLPAFVAGIDDLAELVPHIVWVKAADGSTAWINRRGAEWAGVPREATYGWSWLDLVHPDDVEVARTAWQRAVAEGVAYEADIRMRNASGEYRWMAPRGAPVLGADARIEWWVGTLTDVDERVRLDEGLRHSRRELATTLTLLETLQATAPVGLAFVDRDFRKVLVNDMLARTTGVPVEDQLGRTVADLVPELWPNLEPIYRQVLDTGEAVLGVEMSSDAPGDEGATKHWLTSYYPVRIHGEITGIGVVVVDVTEQKESERAQRFQARLLDAAGEAIIALDLDDQVVYANAAAERTYGFEPGGMVGHAGRDIFPLDGGDSRAESIRTDLDAGGAWSGEFVARRRDGTTFPISVTATPVLDEDGEPMAFIGVSADITERKRAEEFRAAVMEHMAEGLYTLDQHGELRYMNRAATRMLGWTPEELRGRSMHEMIHFQRPDGTPVSTDECPLLQAQAGGRTVRMAEDTFTRKDGSTLPVAYSSSPITIGDVVEGLVVVFRDTTEEQDQRARVERELAALSWVGRIRDALDEDRFVLYSQPIVGICSDEDGEELLLRMISPSGEIILPGAFLPVAEKFGIIAEIDRWVVAQAVRRAALGKRVEVNLSAASIGTLGLLSFIENEIRVTGADPANLVFEITETALMQDIDVGEVFAQGLSNLGCGLALDDFGTGFGSFTYLKRLPVDYLKIDVEFTRDLESSAANRHVIKAIVSLAQAFGLRTIAEGVEDETTLALLREDGVDFAQGFHIGRPVPMDRI